MHICLTCKNWEMDFRYEKSYHSGHEGRLSKISMQWWEYKETTSLLEQQYGAWSLLILHQRTFPSIWQWRPSILTITRCCQAPAWKETLSWQTCHNGWREPKLPLIDPTMEVYFVKHDLRNISAFVEDGIRADRPELQWVQNVSILIMHFTL